MSDMPNDGSTAVDDAALFDQITSNEPPEGGSEPEPAQQSAPTALDTSPAPEPAIPPSRLREEADARRQAERERDELRGRLAAFEQSQRPQQQQPQAAPEIWDDPVGAIRHAVNPQLDQFQNVLMTLAKDNAELRYTPEKVTAAEQAFISAMNSRTLDPSDYQRVANAPNRYAAAVEWHQRQSVLAEVGNDPAAYKQRVLDEALKDPAFQKRVFEATRGAAQGNPPVVTRAPVSSIPSLNRVGAAGLTPEVVDPSDAELFTSIVTRRRA